MVFELLHPKVRKLARQRFETPSYPQQLAIPCILKGEDVLLIAETGTGKTEAAILPLLSFLVEKEHTPIAILYITPLRALNRDLLQRLVWWCNSLELEISVRHGDTSAYERKLQLQFPSHLLIVTIETLQPLLVAKKFREHLRNVKYVLVDEVHEVADSKRGVQLSLALRRLKELCGDFQLLMLSATVGQPQEVAKFFAGWKKVRIVRASEAKQMKLRVVSPLPASEEVEIFSRETAGRLQEIRKLLQSSTSSLVFTNTREFAEILSSRLKLLDPNLPLGVHHSSLSREVRMEVEKKIKEGKLNAVVTTSSLQLGIDIGSVDHVLQYMSPRQVTQLLQRVGRSGHGLRRISKGTIVCTNFDDLLESAVLARKALRGELEKVRFHRKSLDVLAHQLVGLTLERGRISLEDAFRILRATSYEGLSFKEFCKLCEFLKKVGLVFLNKEIRRKRIGLNYYFENLSTIPSIKQYKIVNVLDQSVVGTLDEEFVALHLEPGSSFIVKGEAWKVLSLEEDTILVEPSEEIEAAVPAWEGELIPVPFEVAQEVGSLRARIASLGKEEVIKILKDYCLDERATQEILKFMERQKEFELATDKKIVVEKERNVFVVHACFGSLVNETLAKLFASKLSRFGELKVTSDPYRIILEIPVATADVLKDVLSTNPKELRFWVEKALTQSKLFEWKFLHVARRFGIIRKEAELGKLALHKLIEEFHSTPVYEETLREVETEKLDLETTEKILQQIQSGEIEVKLCEKISPLGRIGLEARVGEVILPEEPLLEVFKKRLLETRLTLFCLHCASWNQSFKLKEVPEDLRCKNCGARLLAVAKSFSQKDLKLVKKRRRKVKLGREERARFQYLQKTAELFLTYRKQACIALAGRGIGPETAKRILARKFFAEDEIFKEILRAERLYLQTKKFWRV